jgi:hypothetical protein
LVAAAASSGVGNLGAFIFRLGWNCVGLKNEGSGAGPESDVTPESGVPGCPGMAGLGLGLGLAGGWWAGGGCAAPAAAGLGSASCDPGGMLGIGGNG